MKIVKSGQKVQLEFYTSPSEKMQIMCRIKFVDKDRLTLSYPDQIMRFCEFLTEGTEIRAFVFTEANIQILDSIVITAPNEDAFEIEYPEDYRTIQRRAYIRENLSYKIIIQTDSSTNSGLTKDMGGGGFRFVSEEQIQENSYIAVWISIDESMPSVKCHGKVSRKAHFKPNEYLMEFTEISEKDRNIIIKKCIEKQVLELRK